MDMKNRLQRILDEIEHARNEAGRTDPVHLMAVSKTHPYEAVEEAMRCGQTLFGENRVQEIQQKFPFDRVGSELHLIGHLQSNKVKKAVQLVDAIDSVDSLKLLRLIETEAGKLGKRIDILFEVNTSAESAKSGFTDELSYFEAVEAAASMQWVRVCGLMTIGPLSDDEKRVRSAFASLRELGQRSADRYPDLSFATLSMGMSQDFPWAIKEGSTVVRVGTAIFGARDYR
ncbi:MAG: YggS family pyridoxal phosphate-dependent enzyme [Sphaerochaetaceae bacterium]|jgi:pyridoxal phosphate enzyme (YggS family)|nr:YggS family pyridoxal phosphate-dependent enzyme [Sphaerochaetaceae bacterium]MDD3941196.1 YggS family pyridoxal phosphate-dependent enzyme [Sphaerochaetaceae bacterium]MDX9938925.1 YggS family pyridoxal phosphate-dependent enzyme [Sphaerochaetaceae bacterium]